MVKKQAYVIHKQETKTQLCKVLNEYNSEQDAQNDLIKLLTNKTNEKELLKDFNNKSI